MLKAEPEGEWRRFRPKSGTVDVYAIQMPDAFEIRTNRRKVDQRKAGARNTVQYVSVLKGDAGDYLAIVNPGTGTRTVYERATFESAFVEVLDEIE